METESNPVGFTLGMVSQLLGFSKSTILRWEREKKIPHPPRRQPGNWRVYRQKELQYLKDYISENFEVTE